MVNEDWALETVTGICDPDNEYTMHESRLSVFVDVQDNFTMLCRSARTKEEQ